MKNQLFFLCFIFFLISSCSLIDDDADLINSVDNTELKSAKSKTDKFVPLKGVLNLEIDTSSIVILPPKYQELLGVGNLTHLGKTRLLIEQLWRPVPGAVPKTGNGTGEITLTAANGDLLFASYDNAVAIHESDTYVWVTFTAYIDGGSGRFKKAEGYFEWHATFNPVLNEGKTKITGKIRY